MSNLFQFLAKALGDGENPSSARLIAVPCVLALILVPLAIWAVLSLRAGAMLEFPASVTGFVGSGTGPLLLYIYAHKREETKESAP